MIEVFILINLTKKKCHICKLLIEFSVFINIHIILFKSHPQNIYSPIYKEKLKNIISPPFSQLESMASTTINKLKTEKVNQITDSVTCFIDSANSSKRYVLS